MNTKLKTYLVRGQYTEFVEGKEIKAKDAQEAKSIYDKMWDRGELETYKGALELEAGILVRK